MANGNKTPCLRQASGMFVCNCTKEDCSDFPSIDIEILENSKTNKTFNVSLGSYFTL